MLDLDRYLPAVLVWASNQIANSASRMYREEFGIGITDWRVLVFIEIYPWSTGAEASTFIGLDKGAVSRSLSHLTERGLLKSKSDGLRKIKYSTTAAGKRLYKRMLKVALAREEALLTGFSGEERELLLQLLHRLLANLPAIGAVNVHGSSSASVKTEPSRGGRNAVKG